MIPFAVMFGIAFFSYLQEFMSPHAAYEWGFDKTLPPVCAPMSEREVDFRRLNKTGKTAEFNPRVYKHCQNNYFSKKQKNWYQYEMIPQSEKAIENLFATLYQRRGSWPKVLEVHSGIANKKIDEWMKHQIAVGALKRDIVLQYVHSSAEVSSQLDDPSVLANDTDLNKTKVYIRSQVTQIKGDMIKVNF